ncbi:NACHT domain-containing protein [Streptomyces sp. cmx-18-6]|uniref:NACHT domain-containing protein n=1 Tax=Streptomyces sp. cmx-18-6 TaxID=2790930 RepID=UPI00397F561E
MTKSRERGAWYPALILYVPCSVGAIFSILFFVKAIEADRKMKNTDMATLLGVPIGVMGIVIAIIFGVLAYRKAIEAENKDILRRAQELADRVRKGESDLRSQLLADTYRINLTYSSLDTVRGRIATSPASGQTFDVASSRILDYFRSTRPRRLVVTGAAGAGKTVLALELILALIEGRGEKDPVPVRVSLTQWDVGQSLEALLKRHLVDVQGCSRGEAAALVDRHLVLPVLDGLDEMDPLRTDGAPDPDAPRARAALEALNAYRDGGEPGPFVLTCRTEHYDALASRAPLLDVARVTIEPVSVDRALGYLEKRTPDRPRWQPLLARLRSQPAGPLAVALSTPWRLCLTATAYRNEGNPSELLALGSAQEIDRHLLARYVPSVTQHTKNPQKYGADDVDRWLRHLASHLNGRTADTQVADLTLHRLWPLAGTARVRAADAFLVLAAALAPAAAVVVISVLGGKPLPFPFLLFNLLSALMLAGLTFRPTPRPIRLRLTLTGSRGKFIRWLVMGFVIGGTIGFTSGFLYLFANPNDVRDSLENGFRGAVIYGLSAGVASGLMGGLGREIAAGFKRWFARCFLASSAIIIVFAIVHGFPEPDSVSIGGRNFLFFPYEHYAMALRAVLACSIVGGIVGGFMQSPREASIVVVTPREFIRNDLVSVLSGVLLAGLVGVASMVFWAQNAIFAIVVGSLTAVLAGLMNGFAPAARRYLVFLLCSRGKLPFRLVVFLDWAVGAGLLRYNGPSYQFRHRELQQWLAQNPAL